MAYLVKWVLDKPLDLPEFGSLQPGTAEHGSAHNPSAGEVAQRELNLSALS